MQWEVSSYVVYNLHQKIWTSIPWNIYINPRLNSRLIDDRRRLFPIWQNCWAAAYNRLAHRLISIIGLFIRESIVVIPQPPWLTKTFIPLPGRAPQSCPQLVSLSQSVVFVVFRPLEFYSSPVVLVWSLSAAITCVNAHR